jgi:hypothetical protein
LRNFGLKVGVVGTVKFEARIKELVENLPDLAELVEPLLIARRVVREQLGILFHLVFASHDGRALVPSPERSASPRATLTPESWIV